MRSLGIPFPDLHSGPQGFPHHVDLLFSIVGSDIFGSSARFFELILSVQLGSFYYHPTEEVLN
jgi:hypothetical protein